jgi:amino acid transporter
MWVPTLIVIVLGLTAWHRFGSATRFSVGSFVPDFHFRQMIFWASVTFALGGAETVSFMAAEVKHATRTIPRALLIAGSLIIVSYIIGTLSVLLALPRDQINDLQGLMQAITSTGMKIGWTAIVPLSAALIALSNLGAAGAYLASTARLHFVAGIDRFLPPIFGQLHSRWQTPYVAILTQSAFAGLCVFVGQAGTSGKGAYEVLVSMAIITYFIPYLFVFASMFRFNFLRTKGGPTGMFGKRVMRLTLSAVGFTTTLLSIGLSLVPAAKEQHKVLAGLKIVGLLASVLTVGALLYFISGIQEAKRSSI